jgi:Tfp pilus assembly protein PilE
LCFFLGWLGVHRFYLGKILTGVLMILTLGGLGIWTLVDFVISIFGNYTDSNGLYVDKRCNKGLAIALLVLVALSPVILGILAAIAIPQYARYAAGARDNAAESAYHSVITAEEAYYAMNNRYTSDYDELMSRTGLTLDPNVEYGPIELKSDPYTGTPGFFFTVAHKNPSSSVYFIDTTTEERVRIVSRRER